MAHFRFLPDLVLLAVAVVWGGSYLATKDLAEATSTVAVLCFRFLPAALIMIVVLTARRRLSALRAATVPGVLMGTLRAATIALETIGVTLTSATNAGLIIGLTVLITPGLESVVMRRRLSRSLMGAVLLGTAGVALLVTGEGLSAPSSGDLLILCAAVTRAVLGVVGARATAASGADVLPITTVELVFGAVIFTLWGGSAAVSALPRLTAHDWGLVVYLSVGCTLVAFLGQLWATKHTSASRAGVLLGTEPGWALAIGILLAGEAIGFTGLLGAVALLIAVIWAGRAELAWRQGYAGGASRSSAVTKGCDRIVGAPEVTNQAEATASEV